jgi:hypothetical protein
MMMLRCSCEREIDNPITSGLAQNVRGPPFFMRIERLVVLQKNQFKFRFQKT